ncbi:MAG: DUF2079 domain-containing protein [Verrucomicrobia bacterium]|nr:DUF2079 domain-containing protein [Verrucomicrobiota bacterium]
MGKRRQTKRKPSHMKGGARRWISSRKPGTDVEPVAPGLLAWCNRYGLYIAIGLAVVYAVAFCAISHFKYHNFNYSDFDLAIFSNAIWNTAHGDFMFTEIRDGCYFKDHVPVILLALAPVYKLFPSPLTLLYAQSIMLGAGAIPLFLLARREINGLWGILFAFLYLLYPAVGFINLFEFHALGFVPALLLFAFYFFRAKRYVPFLVFTGLAMLCREEVGLTVMMIGVYALIARRRWPWIVAPAAAGLVWFFVCVHVIIPHFNEGANIFGRLYGEMGTTPAQVIKTAITDPGKTFGVALTKDPGNPMINKPMYLHKVFAPVGYLALANPEALLVMAPQLALNLLVDTKAHMSPPTIYFQYTATLIPVLFFSSVLGLRRLLRVSILKQFWFVPAGYMLFFGGIAWALWSPQVAPAKAPSIESGEELMKSRNPAQTHLYRPNDVAQYREMLDAVPKDVPIAATFRFLHHLTNRHVLTSFHYIYLGREKVATERPRTLPDAVEYLLLDLRLSDATWGFAQADSPAIFYRLLQSGRWGIEKRLGQLVLLRKNAPELAALTRKVTEPPVTDLLSGSVEFGSVVRLLGADRAVGPVMGGHQVRLRAAWEFLAPLSSRLIVECALFDEGNRLVMIAERGAEEPVGTTADLGQMALAPGAWFSGDRVEVEYALLIPRAVPDGSYSLGLRCVPPKNVPWPIRVSAEYQLPGGFCRVGFITLGDGVSR